MAKIHKHFLANICIIICTLFTTVSYAQDIQNTELMKYSLVPGMRTYVTREDGIMSIMKTIGMTPERAILVMESMPFHSYFSDNVKVAEECYGYLCVAKSYGILKGYNVVQTDKFYHSPEARPQELMTYEQAITCIMRCLEKDTGVYEETVKSALDAGILKEEDAFLNNSYQDITTEHFNQLLNRLLYQKCAIVAYEGIWYDVDYKNDWSDMKYIDVLQLHNKERNMLKLKNADFDFLREPTVSMSSHRIISKDELIKRIGNEYMETRQGSILYPLKDGAIVINGNEYDVWISLYIHS